jgi:glutaredoxin
MRAEITVTKKAIVTIYTRPGCHLCDDAKANILASGCANDFIIEEINIDEDPTLKARYQYDIPVILIDGVKVFKYFVDPKEFKRKLKRIAGL